jgi:hypothetical protein
MQHRVTASFTFATATVATCGVLWLACGSSPSSGASGDDGGNPSAGSSSGVSSSGGSSSGGSSSGASSPGGSSSGASSSGGSSGGSGGSGSSSGAGSSSGGSVDAGCPATACSSGETCCANVSSGVAQCEATCASNDSLACSTPGGCADAVDGGTECCAVADLENNPDGAAFPYCKIQALSSYCGSCTTNINVLAGCTASETLHVCSSTSDCTGEGAGAKCCGLDGYNVCLQSSFVTLGGSSLTCM